MKTHNLVIYHCLSCGAIRRCELDQEPPGCCGKAMFRAAAETVADEDPCAGVAPESGTAEAEIPFAPVPRKPR